MSAIAKVEPRSLAPEGVSAVTLEQVLGKGDLSNLTPGQRVEYLTGMCSSLGLNPLTRPFEFIQLSGKWTIYAKRDAADQLRSLRNISLKVIEQKLEAGLYIVTVRASTPGGREDEDMGAVVLPPAGEARANAIMKAITKAKRRVTLSVCGLGMMDETEVETLLPPAPQQQVRSEPMPAIVDVEHESAPKKPTVNAWLDTLERQLDEASSPSAVELIVARADVQSALDKLTNGALTRLKAAIRTAEERFQTDDDRDVPHLDDAA